MAVETKIQVCDGHLFKWFVAAGLAWLEHNQEIVNRLNVFPVPDGDTGTNMCLTMQKAYDAIANIDEPHVGIVSNQIANGALRGGRGNSGVILSQLLRGFAEVLKDHAHFDVQVLTKAYQKGVEAAYAAVIDPVEGTILTVAREAAEALENYIESYDNLAGALDTMVMAARKSLANTPNLLPVLKKADVVDSGGQGLVYILEGMWRVMRGESVHMSDPATSLHLPAQEHEIDLTADDDEGYGFDVQFLLHGQHMNVDTVRADIDAMGWSTLVVGDERLIKVHVHVHDPGVPLSYAVRTGAIVDDIVVENMQAQYELYVEERMQPGQADKTTVDGVAVIAVATGDGMQQLLSNELNVAHVIAGGQTMNPSTDDFLKALDLLPNTEIILLPNNKNILLAAQQAASLSKEKQVRVITSTTIPQGISAMVTYGNLSETGTLDEIADAMQDAVAQVITCEVTTAIRDSHLNGLAIQQGQYIGLLDGDLVVVGDDVDQVVCQLLEKAIDDTHELVTLYYGNSVEPSTPQSLVDTLSGTFPDLEFENVYGGQSLYPYIFSVE